MLPWVSRAASLRPGTGLRRKHHRETRFRGPPRARRPGIFRAGVHGRSFSMRIGRLRLRSGAVRLDRGPLPLGAGAMRPALGEPPRARGRRSQPQGGNGVERGPSRPGGRPAAPGRGRVPQTSRRSVPRRGRSRSQAPESRACRSRPPGRPPTRAPRPAPPARARDTCRGRRDRDLRPSSPGGRGCG